MFRKGIFFFCMNTCASLNFVLCTIGDVLLAKPEGCEILGISAFIFLAYFGLTTYYLTYSDNIANHDKRPAYAELERKSVNRYPVYKSLTSMNKSHITRACYSSRRPCCEYHTSHLAAIHLSRFAMNKRHTFVPASATLKLSEAVINTLPFVEHHTSVECFIPSSLVW